MEINFGLRLPSEVATVPIVRSLCRATLSELRVEPSCVADVALAVTEACANVIEHAGDEEYEVRVQIHGEVLDIRVIDAGPGFDAGGVGTTMPDALDDRGRGIQLMRALVDRISFDSKPEAGTIVHFEKRLQLEGRSPLSGLAAGRRPWAAGPRLGPSARGHRALMADDGVPLDDEDEGVAERLDRMEEQKLAGVGVAEDEKVEAERVGLDDESPSG